MLDPKGRVILVSGANRGIGRAVAEALYAKGYCLSLGLREPAKAGTVTAGWDPARLHVARYDGRDWAVQRQWVETAAARFGRIDGLVNNAGISSNATIVEGSEAELDEAWAVNCKAPLHMIRCAMPHLAATGAGRIVNIASLSGKRVRNDRVAYAMTKFALIALTHAARRLGWDKGVRASAVCPGFTSTEMAASLTSLSAEAMIDPADLAELVATLIALPNNAAVAELLVNPRLEDML